MSNSASDFFEHDPIRFPNRQAWEGLGDVGSDVVKVAHEVELGIILERLKRRSPKCEGAPERDVSRRDGISVDGPASSGPGSTSTELRRGELSAPVGTEANGTRTEPRSEDLENGTSPGASNARRGCRWKSVDLSPSLNIPGFLGDAADSDSNLVWGDDLEAPRIDSHPGDSELASHSGEIVVRGRAPEPEEVKERERIEPADSPPGAGSHSWVTDGVAIIDLRKHQRTTRAVTPPLEKHGPVGFMVVLGAVLILLSVIAYLLQSRRADADRPPVAQPAIEVIADRSVERDT